MATWAVKILEDKIIIISLKPKFSTTYLFLKEEVSL